MKFIAFAAVASALVVPDASIISQLLLGDDNQVAVASLDSVLDGTATSPKDLPIFEPVIGKGKSTNLTIYQLIASCSHTTNFTSLVNRFPAVVDLLNTTTSPLVPGSNHTLFVPVDTAFAALPGGGSGGDLFNDSRPEVVESMVRYHVGLGDYGYNVMFATHTVPTVYSEPLLGGEPQRLRVRFEKKLGLGVNFGSHVVAANVAAANGIVHGVDRVLVPPSFVGRELSLVPAHYSTMMLAMAVTNFTSFIHFQSLNGSTVLAPSNAAFASLGADTNAFLFNTPRGLKYLKALLKYTIVPNATVYSDAYYGDVDPVVVPGPIGGVIVRTHYDLPTFLGDARVTVDVTTVPGYTAMRVNDGVKVTVQDHVAKNGVVQEVGDIVLPPLPGSSPSDGQPGGGWGAGKKVPITLAELIARLGPYVDDDDETVPPALEAATADIAEL